MMRRALFALLALALSFPAFPQSGRSGINNPSAVTYPLAVTKGGTGVTTSTGSGANVLGTSPTITTPNIVGTATNNSATAGSVGELLSCQLLQANRIGLTTATNADVCSVSLTAGDWDVTGVVGLSSATAVTWTAGFGGVGTTSATFGAEQTYFIVLPDGALVQSSNWQMPIPVARLSLASTTTTYLVVRAVFTGGTGAAAYGFLRARRVR